MSVLDSRLSSCGCCELPFPGTPATLWNRPALDEVAYRTGTYGAFRQAMLQRIPIVDRQVARELGVPGPPLTGWTARESDDYGIALIELWATLADVLTFYQERYVNEAFLRTADRSSSLRRLAGLLGYRPRPGKSAATHLAFELDDDTTLQIPAGLLTQSVPAEGEKPQKFETADVLAADAALNAIRVYAQPTAVTALQARTGGDDQRWATLTAQSAVPLPGDLFLAFGTGTGDKVEERTVAAVEEFDARTVVTWSRRFTHLHTEARLLKRTFRLFGHNAPPTYLVSSAPTGNTTTTVLEWKSEDAPMAFSGAATIDLDGVVDSIEVGTTVLVVTPGSAPVKTTITGIAQATKTVGLLSGIVTRLTLASPVSGRRDTTVVYELGDALEFLTWEVPSTDLAAGATELYVPYPEVAELAKGKVLALGDDDGDWEIVEAAADATKWRFSAADPYEFLEVKLKAATTRAYDAASTKLYGNVAAATHGETILAEVLGDGDATASFQGFPLKKSPLTHVSDATARGGAAPELTVLVGGVQWDLREELYGAAAADRVYTVDIDDRQEATVRFGDGATGARLPSGKHNVVATYRQGLGKDGIVTAGQITTALDRPVGLKGVTNPTASSGGVEPEAAAQVRTNAPNTVRTFDRAVSLRDFEDLAREHADVEKALATWVWDGEQRVVHLTVAGVDGALLDATDRRQLRTYLDLRRDTNRRLLIAGHVEVDIEVEVAIDVEAARLQDDVTAAVRDVIEDYFDFDSREFGAAVHLSDIYAVVQDVAGVVWARVDVLRYADPVVGAAHGAAGEVIVAHLGINSARAGSSPGTVLGAELAVLGVAGDLRVNATGGRVE